MAQPTARNAEFDVAITPQLLRYIRDAPPESAVARARRFGVDVAALVVNLATTTALQRLEALDRSLEDDKVLRFPSP